MTRRALDNNHLKARYIDFVTVKTFADFGLVGVFQKQLDGLGQIGAGFFDCRALTCDVEFRAYRHVFFVATFNQRSELESSFLR